MKKYVKLLFIIIVIVIIIIIFFLNFYNNIKYKRYGDLVGTKYYNIFSTYDTPIYVDGALSIFENREHYVLCLVDDITIKSIGILSKKGKWLYTKNLKLIKYDYSADYNGISFKKIEEKYGNYHVDLNSGDIWQAYITKDAKIIAFHVDLKNKVFDISETDLLKLIKGLD